MCSTVNIFHIPLCIIMVAAKEALQQHLPWFDQEYLGFFDQRKQAKVQWVEDTNQSNVDKLHNGRREASRHCRNKKGIHASYN